MLLRFFFCVFLLGPFSLAAAISDTDWDRRVHACLLLNDPYTAYEEVNKGLVRHPDSRQLQETRIQVLAKIGDEGAMCLAFDRYVALYPDAIKNRNLLEAMAWGIIEKGNASQSPISRAMSLISAFFSNSTKGMHLLHAAMSDSNALIRGIAVKLAGEMRDEKLCKEMMRLLREEKVWSVHLEVIRSVGSMRIIAAKPYLEAMLTNDQTSDEERAAAVESLVNLLDTAHREDVWNLVNSRRMGLRLLGCEIVAAFDLKEDADLLLPLLQDPSAKVRAAVVEVLGLLQIEEIGSRKVGDLAKGMLHDPDSHVAIAAAWLLTLHQPEEGHRAFKPWLVHGDPETRTLAAAALTATGRYGLPLTQEAFKQTRDPYVRINLAIGLISQRTDTENACQALSQGLEQEKGRWMWTTHDIFRALAPSDVKHKEEIPQYPEVMNQLVRLEVIQVLAFMHAPGAQRALKAFLKDRVVGVTGIVMALLLTEGDEEALDLVKNLLHDSDRPTSVQAALILALWGRDEAAVQQLQDAYEGADRDLQEKILESLGHIGSEVSIPFLIKKLTESSQNLRMIAASSLIQCLNH